MKGEKRARNVFLDTQVFDGNQYDSENTTFDALPADKEAADTKGAGNPSAGYNAPS